jgi:uncharacterized protein (DUF1501 family)
MARFDVSRRVFLKGASLAAVGVGLQPSSLLVRAAEAAGPGTGILVKVFLRGGCDGLNLCVPYVDPTYYSIRGVIAMPQPGQPGGVLNLNGAFGLHPNLGALKPLYDQGRVAFVPAVGNYGLTRSHFDAQDFMESGTPGDKTTGTGWLDRAMVAVPGSEITQTVAFASQLPRALLGPEPVLVASNLSSFNLRASNWSGEAGALLRALYRNDSGVVARVGQDTFTAIDVLQRSPAIQAPPANGAVYPNASVGSSLRQAAQVIKGQLGTRCIFVNVGGAFDTHSGQLAAQATEFQRLGDALAAFNTDLGNLMDDVVVMVTTEFGRSAYVNGSAGTDHGSAHCAIVMGNRVRGRNILGTWPGLAPNLLYQQRDLAVGTDFRDLFAELAVGVLGVPAAGLFPGYTPNMNLGILL